MKYVPNDGQDQQKAKGYISFNHCHVGFGD